MLKKILIGAALTLCVAACATSPSTPGTGHDGCRIEKRIGCGIEIGTEIENAVGKGNPRQLFAPRALLQRHQADTGQMRQRLEGGKWQ